VNKVIFVCKISQVFLLILLVLYLKKRHCIGVYNFASSKIYFSVFSNAYGFNQREQLGKDVKVLFLFSAEVRGHNTISV